MNSSVILIPSAGVRGRPRRRVGLVTLRVSRILDIGEEITTLAAPTAESAVNSADTADCDGADDVYRTFRFGRADNVGNNAANPSNDKLYASSKITVSPVKPHPDPVDRATNRSR